MTVNFLNNGSEPNALFKSVTSAGFSAQGNFRESVNLMNPQITFEIAATQISKANYCYIPEFGRYYFIDSIETLRSGLTVVSFHVDALFTYAQAISACIGLVDRAQSSNINDRYLYDNLRRFERLDYNIVYPFSGGQTLEPQLILATCCGLKDPGH